VLAELYISRIVCLHGVPKKIVSDRGTQFTSHFWQQLQEALGTHFKFSSCYHPQTDGRTQRTKQFLEDVLRACALQDKSGWDKRLPYAEFFYNNSYQASLKMSPLQALYGRNCRTPLHWDHVTPRLIPGPAILTPGSSLGSYIVPIDQHESFVRTLSSFMRTRENFSVGHPSQIAPSQARLTWRFFRDSLLKKKMHLIGMNTLLILLCLGLGYPIPGARISETNLAKGICSVQTFCLKLKRISEWFERI
jgi:hypothetical protein